MATASFLNNEEKETLTRIAADFGESVDGQRAVALLALDADSTQAEAADRSGLTLGQVKYAIRKFRKEGLNAFSVELSSATKATPAVEIPTINEEQPAEENEAVKIEVEEESDADPGEDARLNRVMKELDRLVLDLKTAVTHPSKSPYSPLGMLTLVRDNIRKITPEGQRQILESLEGMSREDLMDVETWKGLAYMIRYSAQFQAEQTRDKLNETLPGPLKPDTIINLFKQGADKVTPDLLKQIAASFEGATVEDLKDPETWKGVAYMIGYSAQFQVEQTREKLNETLPDPFKPDTVLGFFKRNLDRVTPDVAKQIWTTFEDATMDDLKDPETWKGVWYMLNYSIQFQIEQLRERLTGQATEG